MSLPIDLNFFSLNEVSTFGHHKTSRYSVQSNQSSLLECSDKLFATVLPPSRDLLYVFLISIADSFVIWPSWNNLS
jgi:hypothetical protein